MKVKTTTTIKVTAAERKAAIQTLDTMKKLFKGGRRWIQGSEKDEVYDDDGEDTGEYNYCLIGAAREADGVGEELATLLLAMLLKEEASDALSYERDMSQPLVDDNNDIDEDYVADIIMTYNDMRERQYKDISKAIDKAKRVLSKNEIVFMHWMSRVATV